MMLRGSTIRMRGCNSCSATNLDLLYPTYNREVLESDANSSKTNETLLNGTGILVTNMTLSFTNNHGLQVTGEDIIVDNVLVHSTDWLGTLKWVAKRCVLGLLLLSPISFSNFPPCFVLNFQVHAPWG